MANLFQPKRVFVPGLLSDEGLAAQVKELTATQKATTEAAPPNTSAVEFASQVSTMQAGKLGTMVDQQAAAANEARKAAQDAKSDKIGSDIAGAVSAVPGVKELGQLGVLTPERQAEEQDILTGVAEQQLQTAKDAQELGDLMRGDVQPPDWQSMTPDELAFYQQQAKKQLKPQLDALKDIGVAKTTPPKYEWWRNAAEVAARSAASVGVDTLKFPADVWDLTAETITGQESRNDFGIALDGIDKALTKMLPGDPARSKEFVTDLASGAGSMTGFLIGGFATKTLRIGAAWGSGVMGAAVNGNSQYEDAQNFDANVTQKWIALIAGAGLGATEAIPLDRAFFRADVATGGLVRQMLANSAATSIEEFSQELAQAVGTDLIAKYTYDEGRDLNAASWLRQATVGAIVGGGSGAVISLIEQGGEQRETEVAKTDDTKMTAAAEEAINAAQQDFDTALGDEAADLPGLGGEVAAVGVDAQPARGEGTAQAQGGAGAATEAAGVDPVVAGDSVKQIIEKAKPAKAVSATPKAAAAKEVVLDTSVPVEQQVSVQVAPAVETPEFKTWFKESAVREPVVSSRDPVKWEDKAPLRVYHGTQADFTAFNARGTGTTTFMGIPVKVFRSGIFFAEDKSFAEGFAAQGGRKGRVIEAYLSIQNPLDLSNGQASPEAVQKLIDAGVDERWAKDWLGDPKTTWEAFENADSPEEADFFVNAVKAAGFDGVRMTEIDPEEQTGDGTRDVWVAFEPTQIKSATSNDGSFDANDPNIDSQIGQPVDPDIVAQVDAIQLEPHQTNPLPDIEKGLNGPIPRVVQAAKAYAAAIGLPHRRARSYVKVDTSRAARVAAAYTAMKHEPNDPTVQAAYQALADETVAQYQYVKATGLKIETILPGQPDPYPNGPRDVLKDINAGHIWYFPTDQGFGSSEFDPTGNPLLDASGETSDNGQPMVVNDLFRVVHDFFGHGLEGAGFGARGEENAWQSHMRLFTASAVPAMTSETRGQNSWVNYGPFGEQNRADPKNTTYADQKTGLMPSWTWTEGVVDSTAEDVDAPVETNTKLYHGTLDDFAAFSVDELGKATNAFSAKRGVFLTSNPKLAEGYAIDDPYDADWLAWVPRSLLRAYARLNEALVKAVRGRGAIEKGRVLTVEVGLQNPMVIDMAGDEVTADGEGSFTARIDRAIADGHDGVIFKNARDPGFTRESETEQGDVVVVFDPAKAQIVSKRELGGAEVQVASSAAAKQFLDAFLAAKNASPFGAAAHAYSPAEYAKMRTFLAPDGLSGFALKGTDIVSVFSHPAAGGGRLRKIIDTAVANGGKTLDAFDGKLVQMYSALGFREVRRESWNDQHRPEGWKDAWGKPDVVFMEYDGDIENAMASVGRSEQINSPEFKKWFGQSKVVDEAGAPLVVYHGTAAGPFSAFDKRPGLKSSLFGAEEVTRHAFFFAFSARTAEEIAGPDGRLISVYIKADKVLDLSAGYFPDAVLSALVSNGYSERYLVNLSRSDMWQLFDDVEGADFVKEVRSLGYDGVKLYEDMGNANASGYSLAVFEPTQIKSAIGNRGTFDPSDPDILRMTGTATQRMPYALEPTSLGTESPAFLEWDDGAAIRDDDGVPMVLYSGAPRDFRRATRAMWLTPSRSTAEQFATSGKQEAEFDESGENIGGSVFTFYARMENPLEVDWDGNDWGHGPGTEYPTVYHAAGEVFDSYGDAEQAISDQQDSARNDAEEEVRSTFAARMYVEESDGRFEVRLKSDSDQLLDMLRDSLVKNESALARTIANRDTAVRMLAEGTAANDVQAVLDDYNNRTIPVLTQAIARDRSAIAAREAVAGQPEVIGAFDTEEEARDFENEYTEEKATEAGDAAAEEVDTTIDENTNYEADSGQTTDSVVDEAKYAGYDGVIFRDVDEGSGPVDVYVVIEPGNAKSTANIGTYNPSDPDILRMTGTATQRMPYALEPTRPTKGVAERPTEAPNDVRLTKIADNLSKLLNLTVRHGRLVGGAGSKDVMGQFNRRTGVIRLRTWTDLSTLAHEAGHAINDQMAAPLDAFVNSHIAEINKVALLYQGDLSQATGVVKRREGFAEFFRVYTMTPDYARNTWPQLTTDFEAVLDREDPQLKTGLNAIAAGVKAWQQLPSGRLIENTVIDGRREQGIGPAMKELRDLGFKSWMQELVRRNVQWSTNRYAGINRLVSDLLNEGEANRGVPIDLARADDPRTLVRLARNSGSRGMVQVTDGVIGYKGTQSMSKGLREAIMVSQGVDPLTTPKALDEERLHTFSAYLVARRALEEFRRYDAGEIDRQPVAFSKGDAVRAVREWEKQYPDFVKAAEIVHSYGMALWQKSYDAGLIAKETYEENLTRQFYVPLQRDMSDKRAALGDSALTTKGSGPLRSIVRRFRGSDRDIIDPLSVLMQKTFALEQLISENDAKKALAVLSDRVGQAGALVERIPASQLIGQEFGVREVARQLTGLDDVTDTDAADLMTILGASMKDGDTISLFRSQQASAKGEPVLFFWENGKVAAIQVKDGDIGADVVNTMNAIGRENMDKWLEGVAATSTVFRTAITSWPDFLLVNFVRDQLSAFILTEGFTPFVSGVKGVIDEVRQKGWAKLYNQGQGIMGGMNVAAQHTAHVDRDIRSLRAKGYLPQVFGDVRSGWDFPNMIKGFARISAVTETGTRLGIFQASYTRAKREGLDDYQSAVEAAYTATDYIDFGLNGNRMMTTRRLIPFLNAQIQGLYKMVRTLGGDEVAQRKGLMFALTAYFKNINNLPLSRIEKQQLRVGRKAWLKMMSLGLISAALHFLFKDDEDYQEAGEYLRTTGWVIPMGNGQIFYVPKPFELAMVANAVERGLEGAAGDASALDRFKRGVAFNLTPPTTPPLFQLGFEIPNNVDTFTGRPIVPDYMRALAPELQYDNYTSNIAKWLGGTFRWSPMVVDHVMGAFGASAYRDLATMTNAADPTRPAMAATDAPLLRRFVRDVRRGSVSAQDFWSQASSTNGALAQAAASYKYEIDAGNEPAANRRLAAMTADQRAFAVLMTDFKVEEKRLNPFYRATQITTLVSKMRREASSALSLGDTTIKDSVDTIPLTATKKREVDTILSEIARREVRNTLIATGQPGWKGKDILPVEPTMDLLLAAAPEVYDELQRRWKKAKVYDAQTVYDYWPDVRDRLVQDGPDAVLADAVAVASAGL